jgi:hypothetical protein
MNQPTGCGWLCGLACRLGPDGGKQGEGGGSSSCALRGGGQPDRHGQRDDETTGLRGAKLVLAAGYTLLLPPVVLLLLALFAGRWLGEAAIVGCAVILSLLLLLPAHVWLSGQEPSRVIGATDEKSGASHSWRNERTLDADPSDDSEWRER